MAWPATGAPALNLVPDIRRPRGIHVKQLRGPGGLSVRRGYCSECGLFEAPRLLSHRHVAACGDVLIIPSRERDDAYGAR